MSNIVQRTLQRLLGVDDRNRLENPAVPISSQTISEAIGPDAPTPAGVTVTNDKALAIPAFWAGIRMISQTVAGLPVGVFEHLPEGRRPAREHRVHRILHTRPNPHMTPFTLKELRMVHVLAWGNSFCEIELDNAGRPIGLWPLLPDRTDAAIVNGEKMYWTIVNGVKVWLAADRVLHVPGMGFDGLRGYNVVHMHRNSLGLTIAANEYGSTLFGNSGRPSGILKHPGKPPAPERQDLREEWNQVHGGLTKAQRTAILWGGIEWQALTIPPEEAQFLETRAMQIEEVARILNINPILLQHFEKATTWGTGVGQFLTAYAKFTIAPWLDRDEDAMNWDLFSPEERGKFYVKYNLDALRRGDGKEQAEILEIERRNGIIDGDYWLALKDENPMPDGLGKKRYVPMNWVEMGTEPLPLKPAPTPARAGQAAREKRSLAMRDRLREAHLASFEDGARRFVRRDVEAAKAAVKRAYESGSDPIPVLNRWIEEFYPGQEATILRTMLPIVSSLAASAAAEAADEMGAEMPDMDEFTQSYTKNLAAREAGSSRGQLLALIQEQTPEGLQAALLTRTDEWTANRPAKVAANEVVRVSSGAARHAYGAAGVTKLIWRTNAGACPICQEMNGRVASVRGSFLSPGDVVHGGEATPLTVDHEIANPPLHGGCRCNVSPG